MRCTECETENSESARFCGSCGARLTATCPRCDAPAPLGLRFCTACGLALEAGESSPADPAAELGGIAERRRVSVLFVDLDDFTSLAEALDPEEVRALQSRYFETARAVVARYGGTVEKFIGDAVMAVWGAPVAREDDADRAVRCALALVDAVGRLGGAAARSHLTARAGVTSGEAAVTIGAIGQGMVAGDLVNVAARLQGAAPSGTVLVDDTTKSLAAGAAAYETAGPIEIRGRSAPVSAWTVMAAAASDPTRIAGVSHGGPFVGRDRELRELLQLFDGVVRDRRGRLVSITGIAGVGKSRLSWELRSALDARPDLVAWHSGRAPAYGEEITFAAVAEMVSRRIHAHSGTAPAITRRQLAASLVELVRDDEERRWLEPRLAALLGSERLDAFERDELFSAWRRFFEHVAATSPVVLVFEDLQWADPALVDFVEHLGAWARHHPILVVTLARPELIDRRPSWGSGAGSFTSLHLERLTDEAMRRLLELRAPDLPDPMVRRILEHAGGVPLYAVEVIRAVADRGSGAPRGSGERRLGTARGAREPVTLQVPDSLHGVIAARIDSLPMPERRLLLAASVLGRRFRVDGLVAIGADPRTIRGRLAHLVERELLAPDSDAPDPATAELGFVQDIVRDVAYRTLSRNERRTLHLAAAQWLETAPDEDVAESLAGHFAEVHDLAPNHPDAGRIARRAVAALRRAAVLALERHVPLRALGLLEHALRLADVPDQRAVVLEEVATAASAAGRLELAERHLRELVELRSAAGRQREAAHARARLASVLLTAQRNEPAVMELEMALRAVRDIGRDPSGVELAAQLARARVLIGDDRGALEWADRALAAAGRHGLPTVAADLLVTRGTARFAIGDEEGGLADLRSALADAQSIGSISTELRARNNLSWLTISDDPRATFETARAAVDLATTKGGGDLAAQLADVACSAAIDTGDWDWALDTVEELQHDGTPLANRIGLAASAGIIHSLRGEKDPLAVLSALEPFPEDLDAQIQAGIALTAAWASFTAADLATAGGRAREAADGSLGAERFLALVHATRCALWMGDADGAATMLEEIDELAVRGRAADAHRLTLRAGVAALTATPDSAERYVDAAAAWRTLSLPGMLAVCLADQAHMLSAAPGIDTQELFQALGADGLRRLTDHRAATARRVRRRGGPASPARSPRPSAGTARRKGAGRHSRPARDHRSPSG